MHTVAEDWIDRRLSAAREVGEAAVTDAVAIRISKLLKKKLGEAPLTAKELAEIAELLLDDMASPVSPEAQADHENRSR